MGVAAVKASAEPVPPSMGMAKTEAKPMSAAGEIDPRPVQPSVVAMEAENERRISPGKQKGRQSLHMARVCENREMR